MYQNDTYMHTYIVDGAMVINSYNFVCQVVRCQVTCKPASLSRM